MNFKEFDSFSKEFHEILVFLYDDESNESMEEILKLIALWVVSHEKMRLEIEKDLLYLFDLAGSIEFENILLIKSKHHSIDRVRRIVKKRSGR